MKFTIEVNVDKEKMNSDGLSINDFDLKALLRTIQAFDRNYIMVVNVVSSKN